MRQAEPARGHARGVRERRRSFAKTLQSDESRRAVRAAGHESGDANIERGELGSRDGNAHGKHEVRAAHWGRARAGHGARATRLAAIEGLDEVGLDLVRFCDVQDSFAGCVTVRGVVRLQCGRRTARLPTMDDRRPCAAHRQQHDKQNEQQDADGLQGRYR